MGKVPTVSLKARLRILLIVSSVLPIILVWSFTNYHVFTLYQQNTDSIIQNELTQIKANMDTLMDSMKYMSQQLVNDENLLRKIRENFSDVDSIQEVNNIEYIRDQIVVYEISNPNINNITIFYRQDGVLQKLNSSSLVKSKLPGRDDVLSTQSRLAYYGPHETLSRISDYLVLSLVREWQIPNSPELYLYIESGYNQISGFSAKTLDKLGAVYTVVSDQNKIIYSSNEDKLKPYSDVPTDEGKGVDIDGDSYLSYRIDSDHKWSLQVFVPNDAYDQYIKELTWGFIVAVIIAIGISLGLSGFIWNSVNHPFNLFIKNLDRLLAEDGEAKLETIYVKEFDQNFEYFKTLKLKILALVELTQKQEQEKAQLQIKQLFAKINPHFIHNTLDTLKWYSSRKKYTDVEGFVSSLNRLLMYNMEKDQITTLQSELSAVDDYIALQKLKYDLEYHKEIRLPEPMLQTELPRFILQPLVENAIFHGLEGKGSVWMRVGLLQNGKISIQVVNNGQPLDMGKIQAILNSSRDLSSNGIGLQYVVRMLETKFHSSFHFDVQTVGKENRMILIIPYNRGEYYAKDSDC